MKSKQFMKPSKGIITIFLLIFLLMFFFVLPFFSSCRAGGIACRLDEPQNVCEQSNKNYRRNCEMYIGTISIIFLILSYVISTIAVNIFGESKIGKFISNYFWKILVIGIVLTLISTIRAEREAVPDLEQVVHGFPLPWLIHVLGGFGDPVDEWYVQWAILLIDFIFWYVISIIIFFIWNKYKGMKK